MADQYKDIVHGHSGNGNGNGRKTEPKKDKLAETKRAEREAKDRLKAEQKAAKERKKEAAHTAAAEFRQERALSGAQTKRASKDAREALRREAHKSGEFCEHGVWKCAICNPTPRTGKANHHKDAAIPIDTY